MIPSFPFKRIVALKRYAYVIYYLKLLLQERVLGLCELIGAHDFVVGEVNLVEVQIVHPIILLVNKWIALELKYLLPTTAYLAHLKPSSTPSAMLALTDHGHELEIYLLPAEPVFFPKEFDEGF